MPGPAWAELHPSPRWQQAVPPRTIPPRDLLPLLVIQLSGCKMNRRRRMMEKGALPTLPAPGVHPLLQPLLFTQPVTPPHRVAVD